MRYSSCGQHFKHIITNLCFCLYIWTKQPRKQITRSSATAKSTARPSCLVGVLYNIYRETNNRSTATQPLVRNWPWNLPQNAITQNNGHYNVQGHSRSPILVPIESPCTTSHYWLIVPDLLSCTISKLRLIICKILARDSRALHFNALAGGDSHRISQ